MVTGVQDGHVGHADAPACPGAGIGMPVEPAGAGTGTTGMGTLGELVEPACPGAGTTGTDGEADGEGVAKTGGPTK